MMGWLKAIVRWFRALFGGGQGHSKPADAGQADVMQRLRNRGFQPAASPAPPPSPPFGADREPASDATLFLPGGLPPVSPPPSATPRPAPAPSYAPPPPSADGGPEMSLRLESDAKTHEGRVRRVNEDSFFASKGNGIWAVADGMGGHDHGDWASAKIVEELGKIDHVDGFDEACAAIVSSIKAANAAIYAESLKRGKQMGSTIVAFLVQKQRFGVFWVGDSRAYLLRGHELKRLSRDHSQVQEMVDRGLMEPEDAIGHPMGHILSRAVGVRPDVEVDSIKGAVEPGDTFLLCSDGLHGYVDEAEIAELLGHGTPEESSAHLVDTTLDHGAPDNVTVITISVSEPTLLTLPEPVKSS